MLILFPWVVSLFWERRCVIIYIQIYTYIYKQTSSHTNESIPNLNMRRPSGGRRGGVVQMNNASRASQLGSLISLLAHCNYYIVLFRNVQARLWILLIHFRNVYHIYIRAKSSRPRVCHIIILFTYIYIVYARRALFVNYLFRIICLAHFYPATNFHISRATHVYIRKNILKRVTRSLHTEYNEVLCRRGTLRRPPRRPFTIMMMPNIRLSLFPPIKMCFFIFLLCGHIAFSNWTRHRT